MRIFTTALLLLLPLPIVAQSRFDHTLTIGTLDSIWSATLNEQRPYLVYTPPSYGDTTITPQRYPVLYLLDGDAHFHSVSGLIQILGTGVNATYAIPEMLVVAIPNTNRTRDLTPTHTTSTLNGGTTTAFDSSGGNGIFFRFMQNELIPQIESTYRTMPYRVFVGHSFGGITTLNALYTIPETFDAYVSIDPSLWWDHETLLRQARDYFSHARLDGKALYLAQANTRSPDDTVPARHFSAISRFNEVMRAYDESGIRYDFKYYDHDNHGSVPLIAEYDALRFIFDGYRVPVQRVIADPALLTAHFERISERLGKEFRPPESMLKRFARITAGPAEDTTAAIGFGELWMTTYPESYRAYEFLGDVWAGKGDQARARTYYERALARSTRNSEIREKLDQLGR